MNEENRQLEDIYLFWLDRVAKAKKRATNRIFDELDLALSADQWIILKRLSERDVANQAELARDTLKDPASLTRSLDLLEKKDLIVRRTGIDDRRSFDVFLTEEGRDVVKRVLPWAIRFRKKGLDGISEADLTVFRKVILRMTENMEYA